MNASISRPSPLRLCSARARITTAAASLFIASCGGGGGGGGGFVTPGSTVNPIRSQRLLGAADESVLLARPWLDGGLATFGLARIPDEEPRVVAVHHGAGGHVDWSWTANAGWSLTSIAAVGSTPAWLAFVDDDRALVARVAHDGSIAAQRVIGLASVDPFAHVEVDGLGHGYLVASGGLAGLGANAQPAWAFVPAAPVAPGTSSLAMDPRGGAFAATTLADGSLAAVSIAPNGTPRWQRTLQALDARRLYVVAALPSTSGHHLSLLLASVEFATGVADLYLARIDAAGVLSARQLVTAEISGSEWFVEGAHVVTSGKRGHVCSIVDSSTLPTEVLLVRIDGQGVFVWARRVPLPSDGAPLEAESVASAGFSDGSVAIYVRGPAPRGTRIAKITGSGALAWSKSFGSATAFSAPGAARRAAHGIERFTRIPRSGALGGAEAAESSSFAGLAARPDGGLIAHVTTEVGEALCGISAGGALEWSLDVAGFAIEEMLSADGIAAFFVLGTSTATSEPLVWRLDRNPANHWARIVPARGAPVVTTEGGIVLASSALQVPPTGDDQDLVWYSLLRDGSSDAECVISEYALADAAIIDAEASQALFAFGPSPSANIVAQDATVTAPAFLSAIPADEIVDLATDTEMICR